MLDAGVLKLPFGLRSLRRLQIPHKLGVLDRLYGHSLAAHGITWVNCANGVVWKLNLADACHRWIVYGDYEGPVVLNWIRRWMRTGGVYVDSGANIGQMLLYVAPLPAVKVIAFEPLPRAVEWLRECIARQGSEWQVTLIEKGLWDKPGHVELQKADAQSTMRKDWYQSKDLGLIDVDVDTLDHQLEEIGVQHVRLWKLDVEGVEVRVLRGVRQFLRKAAIDAIVLEVCPPNYGEVTGELRRAEYQLFRLAQSGHLMKAPDVLSGTTNLLALSPRAREEVDV